MDVVELRLQPRCRMDNRQSGKRHIFMNTLALVRTEVTTLLFTFSDTVLNGHSPGADTYSIKERVQICSRSMSLKRKCFLPQTVRTLCFAPQESYPYEDTGKVVW